MALQLVSNSPMDLDIVDSLKETQNIFKELERDDRETVLDCKEWRSQRIKSIDAVDGLQRKLEKIEYNCNAIKGSGAALALTGQAASLVLCLCGYKESAKLLASCRVCSVAGSVASASSSLAEIGLTYTVINEVKEVIKKDEELTGPLMKTLKYSRTINHHFVRIFNCSILSNFLNDSVQLCYSCILLLEEGNIEISRLIQNLQSKDLKNMNLSDYTETVIQNVCTTLKNLYNNQRVRILLRNICNTILENPNTLKILKVGLKLSLQISDFAKINIFSNIGQFSTLMCGSSCTISNCLLNTIEIASHVVTLMTSTQNIKKQSKNSIMLSDLKLALSMELNAVCKIYSVQFETT